jgi:SAM-dependent methyltransferase
MPTAWLPSSDEPSDFRRQAATYAQYRRDYSAGLYAVIDEAICEPGGRRALDLGCGTGLVTRSLVKRGWRAVGVDFSVPMLRSARDGELPLVRARSEQLPFARGAVTLVTCGTAFHWFEAGPTVAEIERVLEAGGVVALFWRYPEAGEPYMRLVLEVLGRFGPSVSDAVLRQVHPPEPFAGSRLIPLPVRVVRTRMEYTRESFWGYISTVEVFRRLSGEAHAEFLADLRSEIEAQLPPRFSECQEEHVYLARKPADR